MMMKVMKMIRSAVGYYDESLPESGDLLRRILTITLVVAAITLPCAVLYNAAYPFNFLPRSISAASGSHGKVILGTVLKEAAMEDRTVILTTLNEAWATPGSMIDLFLESFRIGNQTHKLLEHLVIIALDQKAYTRCLTLHNHCYALTTKGVDFSEEAYFMTPDYLTMMWRRIDFLRIVLQLGYDFIFTDADIMWFRNPFPRFYPDADFQIACDQFNGNPYDVNNRPNGGFNYVKSNNRTIEFYKFWYSSRNTHPGLHDQDVLNTIKYDRFISEIGLEMRFLNTAYFGGFCQPSKDLNQVCTMHANCCVGLKNKVHDLGIMLEDWKKFLSLPEGVKRSGNSSWTVPQNCSLSSFHPLHASPSKNDRKGKKG